MISRLFKQEKERSVRKRPYTNISKSLMCYSSLTISLNGVTVTSGGQIPSVINGTVAKLGQGHPIVSGPEEGRELMQWGHPPRFCALEAAGRCLVEA